MAAKPRDPADGYSCPFQWLGNTDNNDKPPAAYNLLVTISSDLLGFQDADDLFFSCVDVLITCGDHTATTTSGFHFQHGVSSKMYQLWARHGTDKRTYSSFHFDGGTIVLKVFYNTTA